MSCRVSAELSLVAASGGVTPVIDGGARSRTVAVGAVVTSWLVVRIAVTEVGGGGGEMPRRVAAEPGAGGSPAIDPKTAEGPLPGAACGGQGGEATAEGPPATLGVED